MIESEIVSYSSSVINRMLLIQRHINYYIKLNNLIQVILGNELYMNIKSVIIFTNQRSLYLILVQQHFEVLEVEVCSIFSCVYQLGIPIFSVITKCFQCAAIRVDKHSGWGFTGHLVSTAPIYVCMYVYTITDFESHSFLEEEATLRRSLRCNFIIQNMLTSLSCMCVRRNVPDIVCPLSSMI